jgi:predicted nuclease of predicted toxin-antitoxin system
MRILVDENIPFMTVKALRERGYDVKDVRRTSDQGIPDEELWEMAQQENRLLITTDKGFSMYRNEVHTGILIIRLKKPNRLKIHKRVMKAIDRYSEKQWRGLLVVMKDTVQSTWKSRKRRSR